MTCSHRQQGWGRRDLVLLLGPVSRLPPAAWGRAQRVGCWAAFLQEFRLIFVAPSLEESQWPDQEGQLGSRVVSPCSAGSLSPLAQRGFLTRSWPDDDSARK